MSAIRIEGLTKKYKDTIAVDNLSLTIEEGELLSLLGVNGAGKTTEFNLLTGVYQPTTGTFYLNGEELKGKTQEQINRKGIARTFQNIRLFNNMSVIRNVLVGLHNQKEFKCNPFVSLLRLPMHYKTEAKMREKAKEILRIVDLEDERNNLACNLPYGKQRKLEIARALATNPKLLLLDEPVNIPLLFAHFRYGVPCASLGFLGLAKSGIRCAG